MTPTIYIRSQRSAFAKDGKPALKCNSDGLIQANVFGDAREWETWTLHNISGDFKDGYAVVALQAWTGKFLSAKPDGSVRADTDTIDDWEKWKVENTDDYMYVAFTSHHGKNLVCDDFFRCGETVRADRPHVTEWEKWAITNDPKAFTSTDHNANIRGTLITAGSVVTAGAVAIPLLGFGAGGVVTGSIAALIQSIFYKGATCGFFSALQSAGATLAWVPYAAGGATSAITGAVFVPQATYNDVYSALQSDGAALVWVPIPDSGATATGSGSAVLVPCLQQAAKQRDNNQH